MTNFVDSIKSKKENAKIADANIKNVDIKAKKRLQKAKVCAIIDLANNLYGNME